MFIIDKLESMRDNGRSKEDYQIERLIQQDLEITDRRVQNCHDSSAEYVEQLKNSDFEVEEGQISILYDEDEEVKVINERANSSALFRNSQLDESDRWFFNQ